MPISHKLEVNLEQHNSYSKHALLKVAPKASLAHVNVQRGSYFLQYDTFSNKALLTKIHQGHRL